MNTPLRNGDRMTLVVYTFLIVQLCIWVGVARAQSQETATAVLMVRTNSLETRVSSLESLNLPARVAVLEQSVVEIREVRTIVYGIFATFIGALILQVVQVRQARNGRRPMVELGK
jgi:hypothetical protein